MAPVLGSVSAFDNDTRHSYCFTLRSLEIGNVLFNFVFFETAVSSSSLASLRKL